MDLRSSGNWKPPDILADGRFRQAFAELLAGNNYAKMTSNNRWDYAVEIHVLRRIGLSNNDLRLLVQMRVVEYAQEVTAHDSDRRTFRPCGGVAFAKRTCFVVTPLGIAKAHRRSSQAVQPELVQTQTNRPPLEWNVPKWDSARRVLFYDGQTVKQFARPAVNQELLLSAFEEEGWPPRILDPLAPQIAQVLKRRLAETIRSLNQGQAHPLIHFHGDGTGEGIFWEPVIERRFLRIPRLRMH